MVELSSDLRKTWDAGNRIKLKELSRRMMKRQSQDGSYTGKREQLAEIGTVLQAHIEDFATYFLFIMS